MEGIISKPFWSCGGPLLFWSPSPNLSNQDYEWVFDTETWCLKGWFERYLGFRIPEQRAKQSLMCGWHQRQTSTGPIRLGFTRCLSMWITTPTDQLFFAAEHTDNSRRLSCWWTLSLWVEVNSKPHFILPFVWWYLAELLRRKDVNQSNWEKQRWRQRFPKVKAGTGNIANFLWLDIFYCLLHVRAQSRASLTCFFTGDYSKNKLGSQAGRAWDLHEAQSHLWDQCCHFVDQATQIHHARCISFAK